MLGILAVGVLFGGWQQDPAVRGDGYKLVATWPLSKSASILSNTLDSNFSSARAISRSELCSINSRGVRWF